MIGWVRERGRIAGWAKACRFGWMMGHGRAAVLLHQPVLIGLTHKLDNGAERVQGRGGRGKNGRGGGNGKGRGSSFQMTPQSAWSLLPQ